MLIDGLILLEHILSIGQLYLALTQLLRDLFYHLFMPF